MLDNIYRLYREVYRRTLLIVGASSGSTAALALALALVLLSSLPSDGCTSKNWEDYELCMEVYIRYITGIYRYLECLDKLSGCLIACLLACLLDDARLKFVLQEGGEESEKVE